MNLHARNCLGFATAAVLTLAAALCAAPAPPDDVAHNDVAHKASATVAAPVPSHPGYDWQKWRSYWAFQPIRKPQPPDVKNTFWVRNPIDRFVLAKLEARGLTPAPPADKLTLLRRATLDLTGLPPTPDEIKAFLADTSDDAYDKLVDRLLKSPHYGERWGRHWLDVARYVQGKIKIRGDDKADAADTYREYVVRAFNSDKPYGQFIVEQLAGDLLPPGRTRGEQMDRITAPAFLSIGAWFDQCTDPNRLELEIINDMIDTTSKAFLGLSMSCARCHDHKFDPIPTDDYYALGGIFTSTRLVGQFSEYWRDGRERQRRPLAMPDEVAANDRIRARIAQQKADLWLYLQQQHDAMLARWKVDEPAYRKLAQQIQRPHVVAFEAEDFDGVENLRIADVQRGGQKIQVVETRYPLRQWIKFKVEAPATNPYVFEALYCADGSTPIKLTVNGETVDEQALGESTGGWGLDHLRWGVLGAGELREGLNFIRMEISKGQFPRLDKLRIVQRGDAIKEQIAKLAGEHQLDARVLWNFVKDANDPWPSVAGIEPYLDESQRQTVQQRRDEMARLAESITPYELTLAVTDAAQPTDMPVHIAGDVYNVRGDTVPRGLPRLLDGVLPRPAVASDQSGRLQLAQWLADPRHPLTWRVMANRIWHWHFGRGIVATPSEFGSRGAPPSHPELLDWLAATFIEQGQSVKALHRLIMTSSTYRMSSRFDQHNAAIDPDDRDLWRYNRRRLEAEAIYDGMLTSIGKVPRQPAGQPLDPAKSYDRAMYVLTSRRSPLGLGVEIRKMLPLFDYDDSGLPIGARPISSTPAQQLFWLNNPLVKYYAGKFAGRLLAMDKLTDAQRLERAYLIALGRPPTPAEAARMLAYAQLAMKQEGASKEDAWSLVCQAIYSSSEFRYIE